MVDSVEEETTSSSADHQMRSAHSTLTAEACAGSGESTTSASPQCPAVHFEDFGSSGRGEREEPKASRHPANGRSAIIEGDLDVRRFSPSLTRSYQCGIKNGSSRLI